MTYHIYNFTQRGKPKFKVQTNNGRKTLYVGEGTFPEERIDQTIEVLKRLNTKTTSDLQAMRKDKV